MKDEQMQQEKGKEFKDFALFALRNVNENRELYDKLPVTLKQDSEVVITAIKEGHVDSEGWHDLPHLCRSNTEVLQAALSHMHWLSFFDLFDSINSRECPCLLDRTFMKDQYLKYENVLSWSDLPMELRNDIEFARSLEKLHNYGDALDIFAQITPLRQERGMWQKAVLAKKDSHRRVALSQVIEQYAPAEIRSDRELMRSACTNDPVTLRFVDEDLRSDHDFLFEVAGQNCRIICFLSHGLQRLFPDVVLHALQRFQEGGEPIYSLDQFCSIAGALTPEFWNQRSSMIGWIQSGLPFCPFMKSLRPEWSDDEEVFLLAAKHCRLAFLRDSFQLASMKLRRNKKFMMQVLTVAPSLCDMVSPMIRNDFDLCLLVFSGKQSDVNNEVSRRRLSLHGNSIGEYQFIGEFRSQVSERLAAYDTYSRTVLRGMSQPADSGCALAVLNQGPDTSKLYKKRIAGYCDVPIGKKLRMHERAIHNIDVAMGNFNGSSDDS